MMLNVIRWDIYHRDGGNFMSFRKLDNFGNKHLRLSRRDDVRCRDFPAKLSLGVIPVSLTIIIDNWYYLVINNRN